MSTKAEAGGEPTTYAWRHRSQRWIVARYCNVLLFGVTTRITRYLLPKGTNYLLPKLVTLHVCWLKFDYSIIDSSFAWTPACDWQKQLKGFTAVLAEIKQFWNCFVSVSFQFYFNCADSFKDHVRRVLNKQRFTVWHLEASASDRSKWKEEKERERERERERETPSLSTATLCTMVFRNISTLLLIAPSDMLHLIFGTSFLHHSGFLIQIFHPPFSDIHLNMPV